MAGNNAPKPTMDLLTEAILQRRNEQSVGQSTFVVYNSHDGSCASLNSFSLLVCPYDKVEELGAGLAERLVAQGSAINLEVLLAPLLNASPNLPTCDP